jgi:hypothetical protein
VIFVSFYCVPICTFFHTSTSEMGIKYLKY